MAALVSNDQFAQAYRTAFGLDIIPANLHIGVTGTREEFPNPQKLALGVMLSIGARLSEGINKLHHGCASGVDEFAHGIACTIPDMHIHGHPGYDANESTPYQMTVKPGSFHVIHDAKPYKERNRDIVRVSRVLLACPLYPESHSRSARSGTWQTVRMARKANIPVIVITPIGQLIPE
jgi:hypothetical protein